MDMLKSPCLFEISSSFGESSIFMSSDISCGETDMGGPSNSEDTVSELGELLSDLCTSTRSAHSLKSEEPFRFLGAGDFAENDFLSGDGFGSSTSSSSSSRHSLSSTKPPQSSSSSASAADGAAAAPSTSSPRQAASSSSATRRAFLNPHQFFARLRRHFESTMFFDHVESLLRRSNRVFFSGETIVRPSVHFYLVLTDEFCRNDNLSSFLRCVGQRIAPEWSDRYNRDHRLTHACHTFYVTASIAAKALAVFERRASEHDECRDTFRVQELWTEAMEQARQTIDLLKPEFSMCHSFVGCEGASILSEEMNYNTSKGANKFDADRRRPQLSSMDMSSLDTDVLPPRKRRHATVGVTGAGALGSGHHLDVAADPVHPRSSSAPPSEQQPPYTRSLSPEPIPRSQSAAPYFGSNGHHRGAAPAPHHRMTDDEDEISSVSSFDTHRSYSPPRHDVHVPRPAGLHRAASTPFDSHSRRNSQYHGGANNSGYYQRSNSARYSDTPGGYNRESFDETDVAMPMAPPAVDVGMSPVSRQMSSASMSPLRRSKRKRNAPGRFQQPQQQQQQSQTPPPMRATSSPFAFGAANGGSGSGSPRRGDREADLARWKRLASNISERLKRRRFSPQTFLN